MDYELYKGYNTRPGTYDRQVINELGTYKTLVLESGDVVLDIGGNIGSFARYASERCQEVISIEPDPDNYALLKLNAPKALNLNAAVTNSDVHEITLWKNRGINKGMHSTVEFRGRDPIVVQAVKIQDLLEEFKPTKIKVDCEGAEYDFLSPKDLIGVRGVIMELHKQKRGFLDKAKALHAQFIAVGFKVIHEPNFVSKSWTTLGSYSRD
jgi:FkbM family methyltransferase